MFVGWRDALFGCSRGLNSGGYRIGKVLDQEIDSDAIQDQKKGKTPVNENSG